MNETLKKIHRASIRILEEIGIRLHHPLICDMLREKGVRVLLRRPENRSQEGRPATRFHQHIMPGKGYSVNRVCAAHLTEPFSSLLRGASSRPLCVRPANRLM